MNHFLSVFFFFAVSQGIAQDAYQLQIRPFEDYRQCRTGFVNEFDTVWQAVFDDYQYASGFQDRHWIVKKDEAYGLLDQFGKIVLDFKYDTIYGFESDVLVLGMDSRIGLSDYSGNLITPIIYDEIWESSYEVPEYHLTMIDGKMGLLNPKYETILQPIYDRIYDGSHRNNEGEPFGFSALMVTLEGKAGLLNYEGEELISPRYKFLRTIVTNWKCASSDYFFLATNHADEQAILSPSFDIIIPFYSKLDLNFEKLYDTCGQQASILIYGHTENYSIAYDLRSGKMSKPYRRMGNFDGYSLFRDERGWGILNENFEEIFAGGEGEPSYLSTILYGLRPDSLVNFEQADPLIKGQGQSYSDPRLFSEDGLMWYGEPKSKTDDNWYNAYYREFSKIGLIDTKSGRSIPDKYDLIFIHENKGERYYWAIDTANTRVDVYSDKMRLKKSMNEIFGAEYEFPWIYHTSYAGTFVFKNSENLFGAVSISGKEILPFVYQRLQINLSSNPESPFQPIPTQIHASRDGKQGLYSIEGKVLIPDGQEEIRPFHSGFAVKKNGIYTIYNDDWSVAYPNVTNIGWMSALDSNGLNISNSTNDRKFLLAEYFIKDSLLYQKYNGVFSVLNDERIPFKTNVQLIEGRTLIRRDGILLSSYHNWNESCVKGANGYILRGDNYMHYVDLEGNTINRIDSIIKKYKVDGLDYIEVHEGIGILNGYTGKWLMEPIMFSAYGAFYPIREIGDDQYRFWVPSKLREGSWILIDSLGTQLNDALFDFPQRQPYLGLMIVKSDGKYGLIGTNGDTFLPCDYEAIYFNGGYYCYSKNGLWGIFRAKEKKAKLGETRQIEPQFTSIVNAISYEDTLCIGVLINDSITYLSTVLEPLFPLTKIDDLINSPFDTHVFIYNCLHPNRRKSEPETDPFKLFVRNKVFMLNQLTQSFSVLKEYTWQTKNDYLKADSLFEDSQYFVRENAQVKENYRVHYSRDPFVSIIHQIDTTITYYNKSTNCFYTNYIYHDGDFVEFQIRDLFQNPEKYDAVISDLLIDEIQREQSFGMVCLDIPGLVNRLVQSAVLSTDGIEYYELKDSDSSVKIPWEKLPKLKPQYVRLALDGVD